VHERNVRLSFRRSSLQRRVRRHPHEQRQLRGVRKRVRDRTGVQQRNVQRELRGGDDRVRRKLRRSSERRGQLRSVREAMRHGLLVRRRHVRVSSRSDQLRGRMRGLEGRSEPLRQLHDHVQHGTSLRQECVHHELLPSEHELQRQLRRSADGRGQLRGMQCRVHGRRAVYERTVRLPAPYDSVSWWLRLARDRSEQLRHLRQQVSNGERLRTGTVQRRSARRRRTPGRYHAGCQHSGRATGRLIAREAMHAVGSKVDPDEEKAGQA
jgi:hypothetical protein